MVITDIYDDFEILEHWISIFKKNNIFPDNTHFNRLHPFKGQAYIIRVSWKSSDDYNLSGQPQIIYIYKY